MKENSNEQATTGTLEGPFHHHQRIFLRRLFLSGRQTILVALGILEFQYILRLQLGTDLGTTLLIEETLETGAGTDAHMMITLGAHFEVALQLCPVEHLFTSTALGPHPFRNVVTTGRSDLALGKNLLKPAHGIP